MWHSIQLNIKHWKVFFCLFVARLLLCEESFDVPDQRHIHLNLCFSLKLIFDASNLLHHLSLGNCSLAICCFEMDSLLLFLFSFIPLCFFSMRLLHYRHFLHLSLQFFKLCWFDSHCFFIYGEETSVMVSVCGIWGSCGGGTSPPANKKSGWLVEVAIVAAVSVVGSTEQSLDAFIVCLIPNYCCCRIVVCMSCCDALCCNPLGCTFVSWDGRPSCVDERRDLFHRVLELLDALLLICETCAAVVLAYFTTSWIAEFISATIFVLPSSMLCAVLTIQSRWAAACRCFVVFSLANSLGCVGRTSCSWEVFGTALVVLAASHSLCQSVVGMLLSSLHFVGSSHFVAGWIGPSLAGTLLPCPVLHTPRQCLIDFSFETSMVRNSWWIRCSYSPTISISFSLAFLSLFSNTNNWGPSLLSSCAHLAERHHHYPPLLSWWALFLSFPFSSFSTIQRFLLHPSILISVVASQILPYLEMNILEFLSGRKGKNNNKKGNCPKASLQLVGLCTRSTKHSMFWLDGRETSCSEPKDKRNQTIKRGNHLQLNSRWNRIRCPQRIIDLGQGANKCCCCCLSVWRKTKRILSSGFCFQHPSITPNTSSCIESSFSTLSPDETKFTTSHGKGKRDLGYASPHTKHSNIVTPNE